jgi:hypothetical protein
MTHTDLLIAVVRRVPYFMGEMKSKSKLHISMGHQTAVGMVTFFACDAAQSLQMQFNGSLLKATTSSRSFDFSQEYKAVDDLPKLKRVKK